MVHSGTTKASKAKTKAKKAKVARTPVAVHFKKTQLKRLSLQSGVKYMDWLCYEELRGRAFVTLRKIVTNAEFILQYQNKTKLSLEAVQQAMEACGYPKVYWDGSTDTDRVVSYLAHLKHKSKNAQRGVEPTIKKHRVSNSVLFARKVRYYQKQTGFFLSRRDLRTQIDWIVNEVRVKDPQPMTTHKHLVSKSALVVLQIFIENYLRKLFQAANLICIQAHRETVKASDINVGVRVSELIPIALTASGE